MSFSKNGVKEYSACSNNFVTAIYMSCTRRTCLSNVQHSVLELMYSTGASGQVPGSHKKKTCLKRIKVQTNNIDQKWLILEY